MKLPGRKAKRAKLGEYVLASKFSDCDPHDPWRVGFVCQVIELWKPRSDIAKCFYVIGNQDGEQEDNRWYCHCRRITAEEGQEWIRLYGTST